MKKPLLWVVILAMSVSLVAVFSSGGCRRVEEPVVEEVTGEPEEGKIAFQSNRDGNFEIYIMNVDGSGQVNLTNNPAED
ncbi:MAG: hypothetical protein WA120_05070, partial [Candidatus Hydromicrobium sp.]